MKSMQDEINNSAVSHTLSDCGGFVCMKRRCAVPFVQLCWSHTLWHTHCLYYRKTDWHSKICFQSPASQGSVVMKIAIKQSARTMEKKTTKAGGESQSVSCLVDARVARP